MESEPAWQIEIKGPGATVVCARNALLSITNNKLPAAYQSLATLEFYQESVALQLNGREDVLEPCHKRQIPVSSLVREGRILAESDPMAWLPVNDISVSRNIFLSYSDVAHVGASMRFMLTNQGREKRVITFCWKITLPPSQALYYDLQSGKATACASGDMSREQRQQGCVGFSFDSRRFDAINNRLLLFQFDGLRPYRINLNEDPGQSQQVTAFFTAELPPGNSRECMIKLDFLVLAQQQVSSTIFLVARNDAQGKAAWQGAVAAVTAWTDRLEACRNASLSGPGFRRFAPFLWFDRDKPLPDPVLRFIYNMACLERIIVFGEVLHHDLENLLTALLDKGGDRPLRLHVFTDNEYYRDRVNVLRANIQARMIIADEPTQRIWRLEEIISISVVPDPNLYPIVLRQFMEQVSANDFPVAAIKDTNAFLVSSGVHQDRLVAAACVPLARHLGAPLLLWHADTKDEVTKFLKTQAVKRLFLVGYFREDEETVIRTVLTEPHSDSDQPEITIARIPYADPVRASAALTRLFRAHYLLDWLLHTLRAEGEQIEGTGLALLNQHTVAYIEQIRSRSWAKGNLAGALEEALRGGDCNQLLFAYSDIFIGRDEFIRSFKAHFVQVALSDSRLIGALSPVWNDLAVLSDFTREGSEHVFSAAGFAAYHGAPLLLFPAISQEKEQFLDERVRAFENQFFQISSRQPFTGNAGEIALSGSGETMNEANSYVEILHLFKHAENLASTIFPSDVQATLEALNPLTLALYNSDVKVPYETISNRNGPLSLNYAMGRLAGTDPFETSIITSSGMLFAHELQRQEHFKILLCMANVPNLGELNLGEEQEIIEKILAEAGKPFAIKTLSDLPAITKESVLEELSGSVHLFHYSGHGQDNPQQPQRSGIILWNQETNSFTSLSALEIKYRTKLGAHPIVFLNTCFGSRNSRIQFGEPEIEDEGEEHEITREHQSMTAYTSEQIMGASSSFIHSGSAAVMAPLWEIFDMTAIQYARYWYTHLVRGCSISEAALLAKIDTIIEMQQSTERGTVHALGFRALSYVIYGDPTLRLYPLSYLVENHSETAHRLLKIKRLSE